MKTYKGLLSLHSWGEAEGILFLSSLNDPLAEELSWMKGKNVTVNYWLTDKECTRDEAQSAFLGKLFGVADAWIDSRYSECTGYLWTDENLNVGGHDLLAELKTNEGKWLILEIETNEAPL